MKRRFFVLVCVFLFVSSGIMSASKPCKACWAKLKAKGIKNLKVKLFPGKNSIQVHMKSIRQALEKAGINEKVLILLRIGNQNLGSLGSYVPSVAAVPPPDDNKVKDDGQHDDGSVKDDGAHGDGKVQFISMPTLKVLKLSHKMFDVFKPKGKAHPKTPGAKGWKVQPARVKSPGNRAWKVMPARVADPGSPAGRIRALPKTGLPTSRLGLLTFKNSMGQVMVYLKVQIRQY